MFDSRSHKYLNFSSRVNFWYLTLLQSYSSCGILHHGDPLFTDFLKNLKTISHTSFSDAPELGNEVPELTMSHLLKSNPPPSLDGTSDWSPCFMARLCHCPALTIQWLPRTFRLEFKDFTMTFTYLYDLSSDYLSNLVSQHFSFQLFACILLFNSWRLYAAQGFFFLPLLFHLPGPLSLAIFP